jgi:hypothetical protein
MKKRERVKKVKQAARETRPAEQRSAFANESLIQDRQVFGAFLSFFDIF